MDCVQDFLPQSSYETFNNYIKSGLKPTFFSHFFELIQYKLLSSSPDDLKKIFSINEGIEYRLIAMAKKSNTLEELITNIKTKRYLRTSIQRMLTHTLLNITKEDMEEFNKGDYHFGRLLGASSKGLSLLNHIKKNELSTMPLITNINKEMDKSLNLNKILNYDIVANDIYNLVSTPTKKQDYSDYIKFPYLDK